MPVTIIGDALYFGPTQYDEQCNIVEQHPGWRVKVDTVQTPSVLQFEYVDSEGVGHVMGSVNPPSS